MAYGDEPGTPPAAAGLEAGGSDMPAQAGGEQAAEPIHIQADMLPPGIKEGDSLKCTGMDENGCAFELVKGAEPAVGGESWEDGFRKEMSARSPREEATPGRCVH